MVALFNFNKTIEKVGTKWAQDGRGVGTIKNKLVSTILAFIVKYGALGGSRTHDLASESGQIDVHKHQLMESN